MKNPFHYGSKVTGGSFYDRREIKSSMKNVLDGCNNVVLYGPRRYGKSSLVAEMMEVLRAAGTTCVYLNMMNVASLGDFILAYSKAVYEQLTPVAQTLGYITGFFKRLRPVLGVDENGKPELTVSFSSGQAGVEELREALDLPARLQAKGKPLVVVIDEFQYRMRHFLPSLSTVHSALRALVNRGLVEADAKGYLIGDPIFARYLCETSASLLP